MSTQFDSFDGSGLDAFIESPLSARNETGENIVIAARDASRVYRLKADNTWEALFATNNWTQGQTLLSLGGTLYAGGNGTTVNGIGVNYITQRPNSTGTWAVMGTGLNSDCKSIVPFGTDLVVSGGFTTAGGIAVNKHARWNTGGAAWATTNMPFVFAGDFYMGYDATPTAYAIIRSYNGAGWAPLPAAGVGVQPYEVFEGELYGITGGPFSVSRLTGGAWVVAGGAFNGVIRVLRVVGGRLFAGGAFTTVEGGAVTAKRVARLSADKTTWEAFGEVDDNNVRSMWDVNGQPYLGGNFNNVNNGTAAQSVVRWNPGTSEWRLVGDGSVTDTVFALITHDFEGS